MEVFVKNFSGIAVPRNLKLDTNVWNDFLYCGKENQPSCLSFPLFAHFSFSPVKFSVTSFSAPMRTSLQILYTP